MTLRKRIKKLEQNTRSGEPQFIGWAGNPWTPEQQAEALRRHPGKMVFWRSLTEQPEHTARKMADPTAEL